MRRTHGSEQKYVNCECGDERPISREVGKKGGKGQRPGRDV